MNQIILNFLDIFWCIHIPCSDTLNYPSKFGYTCSLSWHTAQILHCCKYSCHAYTPKCNYALTINRCTHQIILDVFKYFWCVHVPCFVYTKLFLTYLVEFPVLYTQIFLNVSKYFFGVYIFLFVYTLSYLNVY